MARLVFALSRYVIAIVVFSKNAEGVHEEDLYGALQKISTESGIDVTEKDSGEKGPDSPFLLGGGALKKIDDDSPFAGSLQKVETEPKDDDTSGEHVYWWMRTQGPQGRNAHGKEGKDAFVWILAWVGQYLPKRLGPVKNIQEMDYQGKLFDTYRYGGSHNLMLPAYDDFKYERPTPTKTYFAVVREDKRKVWTLWCTTEAGGPLAIILVQDEQESEATFSSNGIKYVWGVVTGSELDSLLKERIKEDGVKEVIPRPVKQQSKHDKDRQLMIGNGLKILNDLAKVF